MNDMKAPLHEVARVLADPTRSSMLMSLMDPRPLTAGELALQSNASPQAASAHLAQLVKCGLLQVERRGRDRYFKLSGSHVAEFLEVMTRVCAFAEFPGVSDRTVHLTALKFARTCYDHLAGRLSVQIADRMIADGILALSGAEFQLTPKSEVFFGAVGIDLKPLRSQRRFFARSCLDWSERRPHVAGALGCALLAKFEDLKWIVPMRGSRAVRVTLAGRTEFERLFGLRF
jgi:DNA-binding transcriptional ArsR family regulator